MTSTRSSSYGVAAVGLLVLLRITIGWHLLYEGCHKLSSLDSDRPWSSASYLQASEGPLGPVFSGLVGAISVAPETQFDPDVIDDQWHDDLRRFAGYHQLSKEQFESAEGEMRFVLKQFTANIEDPGGLQWVLDQYRKDAKRPVGSLTTSERHRFDQNRYALSRQVDRLTKQLYQQLQALLTFEQQQRGNWQVSAGRVGWINWLVTWGLVLAGGCMLLGLFSRVAAVTSSILLASFYLTMPPLPGLTATSVGGGHYLYVNTNLIESIASMLLAFVPSGRWAGLDALVQPLLNRLFISANARGGNADDRPLGKVAKGTENAS